MMWSEKDVSHLHTWKVFIFCKLDWLVLHFSNPSHISQTVEPCAEISDHCGTLSGLAPSNFRWGYKHTWPFCNNTLKIKEPKSEKKEWKNDLTRCRQG